jgi:hypothetical protein
MIIVVHEDLSQKSFPVQIIGTRNHFSVNLLKQMAGNGIFPVCCHKLFYP